MNVNDFVKKYMEPTFRYGAVFAVGMVASAFWNSNTLDACRNNNERLIKHAEEAMVLYAQNEAASYTLGMQRGKTECLITILEKMQDKLPTEEVDPDGN